PTHRYSICIGLCFQGEQYASTPRPGKLWAVLPGRDGCGNRLLALDRAAGARAPVRLDPLQRPAARSAADVPYPALETPQGARGRGRDHRRADGAAGRVRLQAHASGGRVAAGGDVARHLGAALDRIVTVA